MKGHGDDEQDNEDQWSFSSTEDEVGSSTRDDLERDEVQEVHKTQRKDTRRLRLWRFVVTGVLLVTALAVTLTTYRFLQDEQQNNFKTAYEQFSRTVADAAVVQRHAIVEGLETYAEALTISAQTGNMTWPFVRIPYYENYAGNFLNQANSEISSFCPIVENEHKQAFPNFVTQHYEDMMDESHMLKYGNLDRLTPVAYKDYISRASPDGSILDVDDRDMYFPVLMNSPPPLNYGNINWNLGSAAPFEPTLYSVVKLKTETLTPLVGTYHTAVGTILSKETHDKVHDPLPEGETEHPHTFFFHPVRERIDDPESDVVAVVTGAVALDVSSRNLLPDGVVGMQIVIRNSCGQNFTYELDGPKATYLGGTDNHETKYNNFEVVVNMTTHKNPEAYTAPGHCMFTMHIYPTSRFEDSYDTNTPEIFAAVVASTFIMVAVVFFVYDVLVQSRNAKLVANAARSNAIVTQLFPGKIRDQIIAQKQEEEEQLNKRKKGGNANFKSFVADGVDGFSDINSKPLAELFLETTVMFADIVGFTAWSSVRDPTQVFTLLETVYHTFDGIAKRRRIFKVETVGDCYVAATGIPEPRRDHAIVMIRFAHDIVSRMSVITKKLEVSLGPDTGELSLRIGIHSGPVTAGVLRGERSRFQLFGDTMNTTARVESTSLPGRVQLSKDTAELVMKGGKGHWLEERKDRVSAKGKGEIETYWLKATFYQQNATRSTSGSIVDEYDTESNDQAVVGDGEGSTTGSFSEKTARLIDWNVKTLLGLLEQVVAHRNALAAVGKKTVDTDVFEESTRKTTANFLEEVKEIITLPEFDSKAAQHQQDSEGVKLPKEVENQLHNYVSCIAGMYRDNPFHSFQHASHVLMSVIKLMSRIVAPSDLETDSADALHDHTYGITSDPLTQFACAISALIHDVDHTGVPNAQLIKENAVIAGLYQDRSVAEQNSLELSWWLLTEEDFSALRNTIASSKEELARFRQLVINSVMATDIVDKDLKGLRNARWDKAFKRVSESGDEFTEDGARDDVNRKATIVIEHLLQASDVSHTMQHWHVYRKWNERYFYECYDAYKAGRAESDPSLTWYKGEIGFFDFYIIPLAKKLKECGVFGVSSGEYLNYAMANRKEWESKGQQVVAEMMDTISKRDERS